MLLNFAIAEDVAADAQALGRALQSAAAGLCELSLRFFESGDALLQSPAPTEYDAVFLDILMPGMNGVETAQRLRELSPRLPLIFITASGDYIWQALPVHPFDYLLKPYTDAAIAKLLGDLLRVSQHVEREIEVRRDRKSLRIPLDRVEYIAAQNHTVSVMTDEGEYRAAAKFSQLQEDLCEEPRFLACNRGVIVNMDRVLRFGEDSIEMLCGKRFPVRQRDKKRLFAAFTQYQFRRMRKEV